MNTHTIQTKGITLLLFLAFICGCQNSKKQMAERSGNVKTVIVPEALNIKDVDIIENMSYVILEEKENSFFGHVAKMRVFQNKIFILDRRDTLCTQNRVTTTRYLAKELRVSSLLM